MWCLAMVMAAAAAAGWLLGVSYLDYVVAQYRPPEQRGRAPLQQRLNLERTLGLPWDLTPWMFSGLAVFGAAFGASLLLEGWGAVLVGLGALALLAGLALSDWPDLQRQALQPSRFRPPTPIPLPPPGPLAWLEAVRGEHNGRRWIVNEYPLEIGRGDGKDVRLADKQVSRHHARIVWAQGKFYLQDRESTAGTWRNGKRIRAHVLREGDRIKIGADEFVFRIPPANYH